MAPPRWAEGDQLLFLNSKIDTYIEARKAKRFDLFWTDFRKEWFDQWKEPGQGDPLPEDPEAAAEHNRKVAELVKQRIEKLKNWFNNNAKTRRPLVIKSQFEFKPKPTHLPQASELYSAKYYKLDIQAQVDEEKQAAPKNEHIAVIQRKTREAFEAAPPEIHQKVLDELAEMKKQKIEEKTKEKAKANGEDVERTPAEYAAAILKLPDILGTFFAEISRKMGWAFSVMGGGPDPANGGSLRTLSHHCGTNPLGHTFHMAHTAYQETFLVPYAQFLQQLFPQELCNQRSLNPKKLGVTSGSSQGSLGNTSEQSLLAPRPSPLPQMETITTKEVVVTPRTSLDETHTPSASSMPPLNEHLDTLPPETQMGPQSCDSSSTELDRVSEHQRENTGSETVNNTTGFVSAAHVIHGAGYWPEPVTHIAPHEAFYYPAPGTHVIHEAGHETLDSSRLQETWNQMQLAAAVQGVMGGYRLLDPSLDPALMDWTREWSTEELNQIFSFDPAWQGGGSGLDLNDSSFSGMYLENFGPIIPNVSNIDKVPTPANADSALPDLAANSGAAGNPDPLHEHADCTPAGPIHQRKPLSHVSPNIMAPETAESQVANAQLKRKRLADDVDKENGAIDENSLARPARNRKPAASKEIVTLTETGRSSNSAAGWLTYAEGYLRDEALGLEWKCCIDSWLAFEQSETTPGHLSETKLRPALLSQWMQKRKYDCIPTLADPATFSKEWTAWWNALQPEWRKSADSGGKLLPISSMTPEDNIRTLRRSGPTGIVTVLIGLKWWGEMAYEKETWKSAVIDVQECLEAILPGGLNRGKVSDERFAKKHRT